MFMGTASATAIRAEPIRSEVDSEARAEESSLPVQDMKAEVREEELFEECRNGRLDLDGDSWQFLIENSIPDFAEVVRDLSKSAKVRYKSGPSERSAAAARRWDRSTRVLPG
jgi:hypothetical protein